MSNDKDVKAIHDLFTEFHYADDLGVIKSRLAEYVATVRQEVWQEAIKVAQESTKKSQAAALNIAAAEILIRRLERAAANSKKGEGNG